MFAFVLSLFWSRMTKLSWLLGPPLATVIAVTAWCGSAKSLYGAVNKETLGNPYSCAVGNFVGLFGSLILIVSITLIKPDEHPYDFTILDSQFVVGDDATVEEAKATKVEEAEQASELTKYALYAKILSIAIFIILIFLIPLPMYGTKYIYSKEGFRAWVIIIFIWLFIASSYAIFSPIVGARHTLLELFRIGMGMKKPTQVDYLSAQTSRSNSTENVANLDVEIPRKLDEVST